VAVEKNVFASILVVTFLIGSNLSAGDITPNRDLDLSGIGEYVHYGDASGDLITYGVGKTCDFTWDIKYKNLKTGQVKSFNCAPDKTIDARPKIDGQIIVWFGGPLWENPWQHEPSNFSVFAKNVTTGKQITLREYTMSESYGYPAISGNKVVWLEHLNLDPTPRGLFAKKWWKKPFNVCGADIADMNNPRYFTIAKDTGKRTPYPCLNYSADYEDVIDISGDIVVWEADGDIYGADISDLENIKVFPVCTDSAKQADPAISGNLVVWRDKRNDVGDIYGAYISDIENIRPFEIIKAKGKQDQADIDGRIVAYVDNRTIKACAVTDGKTQTIALGRSTRGICPAVDDNKIIWQDSASGGHAQGMLLQLADITVSKTPNGNRE